MAVEFEQLCGLGSTIVGVAREGTALARFLVHQGARVTLSDTKPAKALKHLADIEGLDVRLVLGGGTLDLSDVDVLFISPGVPPTAPVVREARQLGVPISSEPRLFTQLCPAPIVGITGSSGKTTTTALVGQMCAADAKETWTGGNIGTPLINRLMDERDTDIAVMELSSFQLELFSPAYQGETVEENRSPASRAVSVEGWSPHIAAITNITPNHLDRHESMADYAQAKSAILSFQQPGDWAILNLDNALTWDMAALTSGRVLCFSLEAAVQEGAFLRGEVLILRLDGRERMLCHTGDIGLRGRHNVANVLTAACCAMAGGTSIEAVQHVASTFTGVPHRLQVVRRWRDMVFVNDSIATSPERAIAALRSFSEPLVLLAGGRDKHLPWDEWADLVLDRVRAVVAFGEAVPIIEQALQQAGDRKGETGKSRIPLYPVESLDQALSRAIDVAKPGDVVLLSPGGTSYDAFEDFEARGKRFRELVAAL